MCGRMSLTPAAPDLEARFGVEVHPAYQPRYNIAPGADLDVVPGDAAERTERFHWGLRPAWVDDPADWSHPINARAETLAERPSFREAFERRRCLVLADGFYEWQGARGAKRPHRIRRRDEEPFAFAGLWESWGGDGEELRSVAIVTTEPNDVVAPIHDRMPVLLEPDEEAAWMTGEGPGPLRDLLDPYPAEPLVADEVSTRVNDPSNDSPDVVEPIDHDQAGLGDYGG